MPAYYSEPFSEDEAVVLNRFFTNTDRPVFGLVNLPDRRFTHCQQAIVSFLLER